MKFFSSLFLAGLITTAASAQVKPEWTTVFSKINAEVDQHSKAYSSLKTATETIGHRLTGSENGKKVTIQ